MMKGNVRSRDDVADVIRNVLVTQKNALTVGMPVAQLESEYREMEGIRIPFRELGYPCLKDFLESLENSDDIVLGKRGSMNVVFPRLNEKVAHISALVCGQKDSSKRRPRGGKRVTHRSYPRQMYQPPRLDSKMLADVVHVIKGAPNGVHVDKLLEYLRDRRIHSVDKHELIRQLQGVSHEISIGNDMIYPIMKKQPQQQQQQQRPSQNIGNSTNGFAEKKSSGGFRPAGFSDSDEDDDFQLVKNAIKNPTETQKRNEIREESKFAAPPIDENANACLREDENCHLAAEEDVGMLVNDRTRFRLEKLIQRYPNGIWCADLPDLYQKEYSIPLNYQDLGFDSVSDYAAHLPAIFHCVQLQDKGDFKLFDAKSPKPEERPTARPARLSLAALHNVYPSYYDQDEPVPVSLSSSITQRLVPEGVMTVGETVAQIFVTELFPDESQTIGVVVVDIITPSFFWIHLFEKANKFYRFMLELHEFYSQHAKKYVIPIVLLERGLNCACIYDNKWHRGVIKAVRPNNTVTIMFYDYGTVMSYSPQDIHFLHRSFSNVPAQAIPCGLYNVKPKNTAKWPKSVCQAFVDRVVDVPLVATLGSLDADNNSMLIALTDTEGENDFHINDWMVNSGLAVYGKMGDTVDMNDTRDESPVITDKSDEMSFEQQWSLLCTQFGLDPAAVGTSTGPSLYTIPEEPTNSIDHSMRWSQLLLFSKQILNGAFSIIKKAVDLVNPSGLSSDASTAGTPQSVVHRMLIGLENLIDMSVNDQNQGQSVNSEPPPVPPLPVPPLPDYTNYGNFISEEPGSHSCVNFKAEIPCINGNFYVQDYENVDENYGKLDGNMNFSTNPFNCPTASTFAPQFYERNFELPFTNHNQLSNNSISSLEPENKMTHESQPEDPKSSITPRESFEFSLGQSAKSFFERLDAKSKLKSRETNPFKIDDESDKFHANNWSPVASSLSSKTSTKNPFVSEGSEVLRKENLSPTRVVYEAPPLMYDLSSENKTQRELSRVPASPVKKNEPETFQAAKQKNVASWVEQGGNLKSNYDERDPVPEVLPTAVSDDRLYPCDFPTAKPSVSVNTKASKVPPPLPPRPRASNATTNSFTENIGLQWYSVAGNAKLSKEYPVSRDIAAGTGRINGERGVTRQTEVVRTVEPSTSGCGFTEIYLTKHTVYAIHLDNEGWLAIEEFLMAFTSYNIPGVVLKILEIQNVHIPFRYIDRAEYPELFDTLERTPLAVPRNHNNKIGDKLHLVPIKSITKMLRKLKIVDTKTVEQALKKKIFPKSCSALYDAFTIIAICGNKCQGSQS